MFLPTKVFYSNILAQELKNQQYTLTILLKDFSSQNKYFITGMKIAVSGKRPAHTSKYTRIKGVAHLYLVLPTVTLYTIYLP